MKLCTAETLVLMTLNNMKFIDFLMSQCYHYHNEHIYCNIIFSDKQYELGETIYEILKNEYETVPEFAFSLLSSKYYPLGHVRFTFPNVMLIDTDGKNCEIYTKSQLSISQLSISLSEFDKSKIQNFIKKYLRQNFNQSRLSI